jgi:hypothetical protein
MITRIRTFSSQAGKAAELTTILKEIAAIASRLTGRPLSTVAVNVGGDLSEVSLIMHADGVDMHDEILSKASAHAEIAPLIERIFGITDGAYDTVYRHV